MLEYGEDNVTPWNLVNHSMFLLDANNIGVIWNSDYANTRSNKLMISIFNCDKQIWRNLQIGDINSPKIMF